MNHPADVVALFAPRRMIIPNQPPLTATKKSTAKGPGQPAPIPVTPIGTLKPQPVPASYTTASTPSRPTFNVQVRTAQPSPHYQPPGPQPTHYGSLGPGQPYAAPPARPPGAQQYGSPQHRGPDYGYAPPPARPSEPSYGYAPQQSRYQDPYYSGYGGRNGSEAPYMPQSSWKVEPAYPSSNTVGQAPPGLYQPPGTKKTYITDPVLAPQPLQQKVGDVSAHWSPLYREIGEVLSLLQRQHVGLDGITWIPSSYSCFSSRVRAEGT
uniref:LIM domain containing preferred translocation partner in lipoma n=1 Tax=Meleagris gallopavo TaxID=9103 RepID=A0A803XN49_MELGA